MSGLAFILRCPSPGYTRIEDAIIDGFLGAIPMLVVGRIVALAGGERGSVRNGPTSPRVRGQCR